MQPRQWQSQGRASCGPGKDKRQGKGKGKGQGRGKGRGEGRGRGKAKAIRLRQRQGNMPANGDHDSAAVAAEGSSVDGCGYDANPVLHSYHKAQVMHVEYQHQEEHWQ